MEEKVCISCKATAVNDPGKVRFKCPSCLNYEIVRCSRCRSNAVKYKCPSCEFSGPN